MKFPVLLTGAAGDIGAAIATRLASQEYDIIGLDKLNPQHVESYLDFFVSDLSNSIEVSATCNRIKQKHRSLWALVHCAGIYPIVPLSNYTNALWDEVQGVNLKSAFQIVTELSDVLVEGGRIVFISSGAAHLGSGDIGYSASKAGLLGLARGLAKVLADQRILVNSICPGLISSQMSARMTPEHFSRNRDAIPLKRAGSPEEVAVCVSFLLEPENSYMTGATIDVNGGLYMR
jgi:NAD(P)-dependent dehydrogenase (short-subunit alcohol dehydrogenase family)